MRPPVWRSLLLALTGALLSALVPIHPISAAPAATETAAAASDTIKHTTVVADERRALEAIDDCQQRSTEATGAFDPPQSCPDLIDAVVVLGLDQQLRRGWRRHLDASGLEGLHALMQRYRAEGATPLSNGPDLKRLPEALRDLDAPAPTKLSWWQRFERWLDRLLSPEKPNNGWLAPLLSRLSIPRRVQQLILYATIAALLAMAAWIIWRELKAAGALSGQKRGRRRAGRSDSPAVARPAELAFEDLQQAPAAERCVWLVRLLVQALRRTGRLSRESALTYRELAARPMFDDWQQRARFERLALVAEQQRYGALSLDDAQWLQLLEEGRSLYVHWLSAAVAQRPDRQAGAAA